MAYGDASDFGWGNIIIKFLLFLSNAVIFMLGGALIALGVFLHVEEALDDIGFELGTPAIYVIVIGGILFVIGLLGCLGALFELYYVLIIFCIVVSVVVVVEIAFAIVVYLQSDEAFDSLEETLRERIIGYFDDPDFQSLIDRTQADLLQCCGVRDPDDWQLNPYFNCSSVALQKCGVPFSCCEIEEGDVINVQCGYQTLNITNPDRYQQGIYMTGCLDAAEALITDNLYLLMGVGIGILVFEIFNVLFAAGLVVDIRRERALANVIKKREGARK